ncbi:MAG: TOBE domain-containing protein [Helicobacter sp.]|nr:TOBE domain-containing protein [Helicobacter sp.]MDE7217710.1 TOBE domain-containing protein [Helicobacter sp.]
MKISARNQLKGKVVKVEKGAVNAIVKLDIGGGNVISATVSLESIKELGIKEGKKAVAIIKATSVMIGVKE